MELRKVAGFASRLEAEAVGNTLEQQGIPFLVRCEDLGIFGPGHSGATPQGAVLLVSAEYEEEVKELLSCFYPTTDDEAEPSE